jgi:hypothetical protein
MDTGQGHPLQPFVNVLVVIAGIFDSEYGQQLRGCEGHRVGDFAHLIAPLLQEFMEGKVLVQVGRRRKAVLCGGEDGRLRFNCLPVQFPAEKDDLFTRFRAPVFRRGEESESVQILLDFYELFRFDRLFR